MAFVYRSSLKQNILYPSQTPGPGQYIKNKNKQFKFSSAPFNNSSNRQVWKQNLNPGPGSYQVQGNLAHQNKLIQDQTVQLVIFQTPKPTSQFKSSTIRFSNNKKVVSPGPGEYLLQNNHQNLKPIQKTFEKNKLSQLQKYLRQSNYHKIRQSQVQQIYIQSREKTPPQQQYRPITANIPEKKSKNSIFFASKVKRQQKKRPQTSIGPGSYNIASDSIKKQVSKECKTQTKSICLQKYSKLNKNNQFINVGPGSYQVEKSFKFIQKPKLSTSKMLQCFGSTVDRFTKAGNTKQGITPGPAEYQTLKSNQNSKIEGKIKKKTTFGTDSKRQFFNIKSNPNLAPGTYEPYNDFQNLLKQNFKNGTIGSFGSTQQRFCQNQRKSITENPNIEQIRLIQNSSIQILQKPKSQKFKRLGLKPKLKKFSSNISMNIAKQIRKFSKIDQRPLCYDSQTFTFSKKFKNKKQIDAPFLTCSQRFTIKQSKKQLLDFQGKQKIQNCISSERQSIKKENKKLKGCVSMKFSDSRFKYPQQKQVSLGPQYYNPQQYQKTFSKKSFNKLFS